MRHDDEIRQLLHGGPIPAEDERLAQVLRELRADLTGGPEEDVARQHLAAITAAAAETAQDVPALAPVGLLRRWGRRAAAAGALKIATVATAAAAVTSGGLAATGNLPQPAQERVSEVLSSVGIHVPSGTETTDPVPSDLGTEPADPAVVDRAPPASVPPDETPADGTVGEQPPAEEANEPPGRRDGDEPLRSGGDPPSDPTEAPSDAGGDYRSEYRSDEPADPPSRAPQEPRPEGDASGSSDRPEGTGEGAPEDAAP